MVRRTGYIRLLLALYLSALILSPRPAAAAQPQPGDTCTPMNGVGQFQWNAGADTSGGTDVSRALFCEGTTFTQVMQLQANGNVGIGTTSPTSRLHMAQTAADSGLRIERAVAPTQYLTLDLGGFAADASLHGYSPSSNQKNFQIIQSITGGAPTNGAADMSFAIGQSGSEVTAIDIQAATAYVGILNTNPGAMLDIGAVSARGTMRLEGSTSGYV